MNFKLLLVLVSLNLTSFSYANSIPDYSNFIDNLVSAFDNKPILNNWQKILDHEELVGTVKEIVGKIKDILIVIDNSDYNDLKNMIIKVDSLLDKTENLYLETRIILNSLARIIRTHERYEKMNAAEYDTYNYEHTSSKDSYVNKNNFKSKDCQSEAMFNRIVLNEYKIVYSCLYKALEKTKHDINDTQINKKVSRKLTVSKFDDKNYNSLKFSIDTFRNMIDNIVKVNPKQHNYILASHKGISFSHKGFLNEEKGHLFFDYLLLFKDSSLKKEESNYSKYNEKAHSLMELFMCRKFVFNESALKFFISLIHLFTKVSGQNTKYEIYRTENELYEIEWSYGRSFGKNWFKNYFLKKSITFNSTIKIKIKNIAYLDNNSNGYSIEKAKKIKDKNNIIRLLVLSCGHQLGSKQLDQFFEKCYDMQFGRSNCPICGLIITVIGSHDVFRENLKRIKS